MSLPRTRPSAARTALLPRAALVVGLGLFVGGSARATPVVTKRAVFRQRGSYATMTVGFREMFNAKLRKRLRSGFSTTVVMRVYVYPAAGGGPISVTARKLRAVYDLWDSEFRMKIEEGTGKKYRRFRRAKKVVERLTSFWRFPVAKIQDMERGKHYFVAAIVEVNPMSPRLLAAVRRWLRKPQRRRVSGHNLFGSFVSIFVNDKIRRAERTFKLRTQSFFKR